MRIYAVSLLCLFSLSLHAQREPDKTYMPNIRSIAFHRFGDPLSMPVLALNGSDQVELHFDDMDGNVRYYFYTLELRNADWSPVQMSYFDYVRGYSQQRISTYRNSSAMLSRYTHYQALLPDRNMMPIKSGNYLLKVFLDGDTSRLAFTRRLLVVDNRFQTGVQVQQPFGQQYFKSHHRLLIQVSTKGIDVRFPQQQVKLWVLQNFRWDNALRNVPPTFVKPDQLEYINDQALQFPAMREWRWANLRSFRLLGDRVQKQENTNTGFSVMVQPESSRAALPYVFFRDLNGRFVGQTVEKVNPLWEAEYGLVRFTYVPPEGRPFTDRDVYVFGALSNYGEDPAARMTFIPEERAYQTVLRLKQGYYDYVFALHSPGKEVFETDLTEGNTWETENNYTVLVYYREPGGRYDQLLGFSQVNTRFREF